jgi:hypothetical protein
MTETKSVPARQSIEFQDTDKPLAATLVDVADQLPDDRITFGELMNLIGEQGILLLSIVLIVPFMTPISVPGVSTAVGVIVMLLSVGVILNRVPWLPGFIINRPIPTGALGKALRSGSRLVARIERLLRPRLLRFTESGAVNRFNGVMLLICATLFTLPLSLIPFSNFLPALAIVLICAGMLTRDGAFVLLGYGVGVLTFVYFAGLIIAAVVAGGSLVSLIGSGAATAIPTLTPMP